MSSLVPLGSEAAWKRALYAKNALLWAFRSKMSQIAGMQWLQDALTESSERFGLSCTSDRVAFDQAKNFVVGVIDNRIDTYGGDRLTLRLRELALSGSACSALEDLFDLLADKATEVYRGLSTATAALRPEWLTSHPRARPGESPPDLYSIDACTTLVKGKPQVELQIFLTAYDACCMMAVPRLLSHELICHVHAHDDRIDNRSAWAEGMMDWTATKLWEKWRMSLELPASHVLLHGRTLSSKRYPEFRATGHYAADNLCQWLTESGTPVEVAEYKVVRLTLELNVASKPLEAKDELVSRLSVLTDDSALQRDLATWASHGGPSDALLT